MSGRTFDRSYESHAAFYNDVYGHAVREARAAGRRGAVMMTAEQDAGDWSDAPTPDLVLAQALRYPAASTFDLGAGRFRAPSMRHGSFICIAPGTATSILVDGPHRIRVTAVPYAALRALAGEDAGLPRDGGFGRLHAALHHDAEVASLLDRLWAEAASGAPRGALWADGALLQLAAGLLRLRDDREGTTRGA